MSAYYNEFDKSKAAWLRELIKADLIPAGEVDERSIEDVRPSDLIGFSQCHFFAGIGGWAYALRQAGWPDDRPVWTASCPCQSFSAAGKGKGFDDERHLWPALFWLIEQLRPGVVFGEQVSSKGGLSWLDLVQADLEGTGYAVGPLDLCAAGVGAPHIRQRLYWVADTMLAGRTEWWSESGDRSAAGSGLADGMADSASSRHYGSIKDPEGEARHEAWVRLSGQDCGPCMVADPNGRKSGNGGLQPCGQHGQQSEDCCAGIRMAHAADPGCERGRSGEAGDGRISSRVEPERLCDACLEPGAGPTNGFWRDADWLLCRDGKWRPVRSGSFPLVNGAASRVGRLRGYGDAIVIPLAKEFIASYMDIRGVAR